MSKQQRFILKLSLTYWGNVNHVNVNQSSHDILYSACENRKYLGSLQNKSVSSSFK